MRNYGKWNRAGIIIIIVLIALIFTACAAKPEVIPDPEPVTIPEYIPPPPRLEPEPEKESLIEMIFIPSGTFEMGSRAQFPGNERPARQVTLRSFYLGKFEVTQGQYAEIMGVEISEFLNNPEDSDPEGWRKLPVENVSWYAALEFCNRLSIMEELDPVYRISGSTNPDDWGDIPPRRRLPAWDAAEMIPGANGYRLPTEAEWEYAAKGGRSTPPFFTFSGSNNFEEVSWFWDNSSYSTHEVGQKAPNALGLHDMTGNVKEWCWDLLSDDYSEAETDNPTGPTYGIIRVSRGGSWSILARHITVTTREGMEPQTIAINQGFRVARNAPSEP
ncbi:MAG: formylglycine-generating enzyme family protein [Treponema sp.]|nr:formylglycine-generating enzyme family protein [Treponema sp.]